MKLNQLKTKTVNGATPAALDQAISDFVNSSGEATYLDFRLVLDSGEPSGGLYAATIIYVE